MRIYLYALVVLLSACSHPAAEKPNGTEFTAGENLVQLKNKKIKEVSGIVSSVKNPGMLWIHNDGENEAAVYLVDEKLTIHLTVKLKGIKNRDCEDIAIGPGPDSTKTYLYIGEIGDNLARYSEKRIYRIEEPVLGKDSEIQVDSVDIIKFKLPDGRKDCETLMLDPLNKDLLIVSKREQPVIVYRLPFPQVLDSLIVAEPIAEIATSYICGGDIALDRSGMIIKNYSNVYYWPMQEGESVADVFKRSPSILPYEEEPQGEAICFAYDESGYYTLSEVISGEKTYLKFYKRNH